MYNGIGLTTPRGSGTNGYVIRNLSTLRSHDPAQDRASAWDSAPPKHREPDEAILEHERKRKVEVKCLELQLKLEDEGIEEDKIEEQVSVLRSQLLENLAALAPSAKSLKPSDTHGLALAKKAELSRMALAFGTRRDYQEGEAFDREKQEDIRTRKMAEREERERKKEEERAKYEEQKAKWEAEKRERDRLRRRDEDRMRREREDNALKRKERMPPPPVPPSRLDKEREIPRDRREPYRDERRGGSPPRRRDVHPPPRDRDQVRDRPRPSPNPSPPPRTRRRLASRSTSRSRSRSISRSPPLSKRRRSSSPPPPSRRDRSPPPSPPRRARDRSVTPPPYRRWGGRSMSRSRSRSRSPRRPFNGRMPPRPASSRVGLDGGDVRAAGKARSVTPPLPPARGRRSRSASTGSSMSVSSRSGSSRSRSVSRD